MPTIVPFTAAMVETSLKTLHLTRYHEEDGVFTFVVANLGPSFVNIAALEHSLYVQLQWIGFPIQKEDRFRVLCGEWNEKTLTPKVYTRIEDQSLVLVAEGVLPVPEVGIHQEMVDHHIKTTLDTGWDFARWIAIQDLLHDKVLAELFEGSSDDT